MSAITSVTRYGKFYSALILMIVSSGFFMMTRMIPEIYGVMLATFKVSAGMALLIHLVKDSREV